MFMHTAIQHTLFVHFWEKEAHLASTSTNVFISITLQVQTHKATDACKVAVIAFSWKCNSRKQHITTEKVFVHIQL